MLTLSNISISHSSRPVVSELSANIPKGTCFVITGGNGTGKSSVMNSLMGLQKPEKGQILLDGHDLYELSRKEKKDFYKGTGLVQQQVHLRPLDSVRKALNHDGSDKIQRERMMKFIALEHRAKSLVKELSYAEKRRLDLARSLVHQPKLVLWDEPFLGMDGLWTAQFVQALSELQELGTTLILSSSHPDTFSSLKDFHSLVLK
jgi:ABC-type multidrug transport system ATPase subunit